MVTAPVPVFIRAVSWDGQRAANARALRREAGAAKIVWDVSRHAYLTFIDALRCARPGPAIHMEDDAILTARWRAKTEAVIADRPGEVIQFFSRRRADVTTGSRAEPGGNFSHTLCFYVPGALAGPLAEFVPEWDGRADDPTGTDLAVAAFLAARRASYWVQVPSLVQHQAWTSAIGPGRSTRRQSETFRP
jgi:hypothetical protein